MVIVIDNYYIISLLLDYMTDHFIIIVSFVPKVNQKSKKNRGKVPLDDMRTAAAPR